MNLLEAYTRWDRKLLAIYMRWDQQKIYERYFYQAPYKCIWFDVTTLFFLLTFWQGLQILFRYWDRGPSMQLALLAPVIGTPGLWIILLRQHRNIRRLLSQGTGLKPEAEKRLLGETAFTSLSLGWFAYLLINILFSLVGRFL